MSKIHLRSYDGFHVMPACNTGVRWSSRVITTTSNIDDVDCLSCKRIAALAYAKTLPKTGVAAHMPSRERLLEQIKADPDDDTCEARAHQEDKG